MLWVNECMFTSSCYSFVICFFLYHKSRSFSWPSVIISFLLLPSLTKYMIYTAFFFYINFFLKIFVYFIMLKISMSDVTFIWEIKDMASIQWMALTYAFVVIDKVELWYINVYIHHTYYWTGGHTGLQSSINSRTDIFQAF